MFARLDAVPGQAGQHAVGEVRGQGQLGRPSHQQVACFGQEGIAVLLLVMGSMDVDAAIVTAGGLPPSAISAELGALALCGTILANMFVKLGVTLAYARGKGMSAALALAASMTALAISLVVGWLRL